MVLEDDSKNGRNAEDQLILAPLLRIAALALEDADVLPVTTTRRSPSPTGARFSQELTQISNFPLCVFTHPQSPEISQCFQSYRHVVVMAQRITESLIKVAMKEKKDMVFQWVQLIASKK
jgi:hypothetical protein